MPPPARYAPALLVLGVLFLPSRALPQAALAEETTAVVGLEEARRGAILATLDRAQVRGIARATGLELDAARERVRLLEGPQLARAAAQAEDVDRSLAIDGTISSTTLIILLVITILIIVIVES